MYLDKHNKFSEVYKAMDYTRDVVTCEAKSFTKITQSGKALAYLRGTPGRTYSRQPMPV
jgi:hypothetical protein